jgi:hypothetical protein
MKTVVNYLTSYTPHLPYLTVSLFTLRQHYSGPVTVYAWPESYDLVCKIADDRRLNIEVAHHDPKYRGKNDQFLDKILVMNETPYADVALYLDADTMINGSLDYLFQSANISGFTATQFNDWKMDSNVIRGRINSLLPFMPSSHLPYVLHCVESSIQTLPSVNGGVFACKPSNEILAEWYDLAWAARSCFIADEAVLHTLVPKHWPVKKMDLAMHGVYNCSPKFQPAKLPDSDVRIWHFHGDSNVRPQKSQRGVDLWWPVYTECLTREIGNMPSWINQINNKWIRLLNYQYQTTQDERARH